LHEEGKPHIPDCRLAVPTASSSCSTSIIISSSLSIATDEANGRTPCERSGASHVSALPLSVAEPAVTLPDGGRVAPVTYRTKKIGRWSRRERCIFEQTSTPTFFGWRARVGFGPLGMNLLYQVGPRVFFQHGARYRRSR
jgi:hypothetical protein